MTTFYDELHALKIHRPGNSELSFAEEDSLAAFINSQSPDWKTRGSVSSIPTARLPRLFLRDREMTKNLVDRYRAIQIGETGEIKIYKKLMSLNNLAQQGGTVVFPNVDGNHFSAQEAKVEIDFVVIDCCKGVFVVSVKNQARVKEIELVEDMKKHTNFIRLLRDFKSQSQLASVPVHGIVCSLKTDIKHQKLQENGYWKVDCSQEQRFVFQANEIKDFGSAWFSMLEKIPNLDQNETEDLFKLAGRIAVLNCMEGTLACIHKQFEINKTQEIQLHKNEASKVLTDTLAKSVAPQTFDCASISSDMLQTETCNDTSRITQNSKRTIILWTKEQLSTICSIDSELNREVTSRDGCRILVEGPKGSGKTMLLCYIAELAKLVLTSKFKDRKPKILVCDGRLGSTHILFEVLREKFGHREIDFIANGLDLEFKLKTYDLVLIDEYIHLVASKKISKIAKTQHCIIFTSDKNAGSDDVSVLSEFEKLSLTPSLRSIVELIYFAEEFRKLDTTTNRHLSLRVGHNYQGEEPVVRICESDVCDDLEQNIFAEKASNLILQVLKESRGLKSTLVTPFVHPITLRKVVATLARNKVEYDYRNPQDFFGKSGYPPAFRNKVADENSTPVEFPVVTFVTGNHVDGAEFGSVIVLIERSLPHFWHHYLFDSVFIALTRATTKLVVLVNNESDAPMIGKGNDRNTDIHIPDFWRVVRSKKAIHRSYSWLKTEELELHEKVLTLLDELPWSVLPIVLAGINPVIEGAIEIDPPVQADFFILENSNYFTWLRLPNENILAVSKQGNCLSLMGRNMFMCQEFSALILVFQTESEYKDIVPQIDIHRLLYFIYEKQLEHSPLFVLTTFDFGSFDADINAICNFMVEKSQSKALINQIEAHQTSMEPREFPEPEEPEIGDVVQLAFDAIHPKEPAQNDSLNRTIINLKKKLELKSQDYNDRLNTSQIEDLCTIRIHMAEIALQVANCYSSLLSQTGYDENYVNSAIEFCNKSLEFNPGFLKTFICFQKILQLHSKDKVLFKEVTTQKKHAKQQLCLRKQQKELVKAVIQDKIKNSPCYELIRFKSSCFLLDLTEKYCHHSVLRAIMAAFLSGERKISLLLNPGTYEELRSIELGLHAGSIPCQVDIVGNWVPDCNPEIEWITKDPPIVIQNIVKKINDESYTFKLWMGHLSLTRVCVKNWQPFQTAAIYSDLKSVLNANQCSFMSKCGAAISFHENSEVNVEKCRFVHTYGAVLMSTGQGIGKQFNPSRAKNKFNMSNCLIDTTTINGIELRDDAVALIENCRIKNCSDQAIVMQGGEIKIRNCVFESNSLKMNASHFAGAIQLFDCTSNIQHSSIRNQDYCGIVSENGQSNIDNVFISNCNRMGIIVGGDCTVTNCEIQHCAIGIHVGPLGLLRMKSNTITSCMIPTFVVPGANPILYLDANTNTRSSTHQNVGSSRGTNDSLFSTIADMGSLRFHAVRLLDKRKKVREELRKHRTELGDVLGSEPHLAVSCDYCMRVYYQRYSQYIICDKCQVSAYCSRKCLLEGASAHKQICEWSTDIISKYERNNVH